MQNIGTLFTWIIIGTVLRLEFVVIEHCGLPHDIRLDIRTVN